MKKSVLFAGVFAMTTFALGAATGTTIKATLKKTIVVCHDKQSTQSVITYKGTTYVPVKQLGNMLGQEVKSEGNVIYVGENTIKVKSTAQTNSQTAVKANGKFGKNNPAPIGTTQSLTLLGTTTKVTILSVDRGDAAWEKIQANTDLDDAAPAGKEYLFVKVKFEVTKGRAQSFASTVGNIYHKNGSKYSGYDQSGLTKSEFTNNIVNVGSSQEGYVIYLIDQSDEAPKFCYGAADTKFNVWFSLK